MALIALISTRAPGSSFQLAKILSCTVVPVFLIGPFACSFVDRWNLRRTMIVCDILRAALVIFIAVFFVHRESIWPIYIIIFLVFAISRFFVPAKMAFIPELVSAEKLLLANSLSSLTAMIAAVAGFGLGGFVVERIGSSGGFLIDGLTYIISALFILLITAKAISRLPDKFALTPRKTTPQAMLAHIKEGWQYVVQNPDASFVARIFFLTGSAIGTISVVIIVFIQDALGSLTQDLGILACVLGLGFFLSTLVYGSFGQRAPKARIIYLCLGVTGLALAALVIFLKLTGSAWVAAGFTFILAAAFAPVIVSCYTLVHEVAKKNLRGRIFGSLDIVAYFAFFVFMLTGSFMADIVGRLAVLLFVATVLTVVGFGAIALKYDQKVKI